MAGKLDLLLEAERRGILPADKRPLLDEARKRGLVPAEVSPTPPTDVDPLEAQRDRMEGTPPKAADWGKPDNPKPARGPFYNTFIDPFVPRAPESPQEQKQADWLASRSYGERAKGAGAFALSFLPRLFSGGKVGAGDIASAFNPATGRGLAESEQRFGEANAPQLGAFAAAGEVAMGTMGLPVPTVRVPQTPRVPPQGATGPASLPSSGPSRARAYVRDLDELGIHRHGPAVAQAGREGSGPGLFAKTIEGMPFVGKPLQRSTEQFTTTAARAADDIASGYGSGNIESAGAAVKSYFDRFKNKRSITKDELDKKSDVEIAQLAKMEPRDLGSVKTAADARYEHAWRQIPKEYRKGGSFAEEPRLMGDMPKTRALIQQIYGDNVRMMNAQRQGRKLKVSEETATELPTRQGAKIKAAIPFRGGRLGTAIEDILAGNWKGSLQTMRDLRTQARRQASAISDSEGNVGNKGEFEALKRAIDADMQGLMERVPNVFREAGDEAMAQAFERAAQGFRGADQFYKQYAETFEKIAKPLIDTEKNPAVIKKIMDAAKKGVGGNAELLAQFRRTASPQVMDEVAAAAMREWGRPTGAASGMMQEASWSPSKFATRFNESDHEALFGHRPELYAKLKKYANVAQGLADYEKLANSSRSGTHGVIGAALLAGPVYLLTHLDGLLLSGAGSYGAARWLSSPGYVTWLTKSAQLQKQLAKGNVNPSVARSLVRRHAYQLQQMIAKDGQLDAEAKANLLKAVTMGLGMQPQNQQGQRKF